MKSVFFRAVAGTFIFLNLAINAYALDVSLTEVGSLAVPFNVSQIEYSPVHQLLFLREDSAIHIIDVNSLPIIIISTHQATEKFTDMDLTSDSNYLFAADYGGEVMGYGNPIHPHWVHRFDLTSRTWKAAQAPKIAWKIEAVSADRVLLQEHDQWIDITLNSFGDTVTELYRLFADYYGDMEYDFRTGRIYHGNSGSSSREINVYKVVGDTLTSVQGTGVYGTAQNGGGTCVLSTGGKYLFYGKLETDAMNVQTNLRFMTQTIYAAAEKIAFGDSQFFDAETGEVLGGLGYSSTVYGVSEDGNHVWTYQSQGNLLHHYLIGGPKQNTPPVAKIQGVDRDVEADGPDGATVHLDGSLSSDADSTPGTNDDINDFNWYEKITDGNNVQTIKLATGAVVNIPLSLGRHTIILEVIDSQGATDDSEVNIIVKDTVPPEFSITASPTILWPANHRMVPIVTRYAVKDNCDDNPEVSLLSVEIKEGEKDLTLTSQADVYVNAEGNIFLRAERSSNSDIRTYTLNFQAVDDYANTTLRSVKIIVPHDQRKALPKTILQITK